MAAAAKGKERPQVFLDISMAGAPAGRIVIELFSDICPKTCQNFRKLCTGESGTGMTGAALHYKVRATARRALNLGVSRAHGCRIGKKPAGRRLDRNDPHARARLADLASARYSVTTWEDIQRFRVQAAATKARHDAWEAKPIAWDLMLAGSFSAMAAA